MSINDLILLQTEAKVKRIYGLSGDNFKPCVCVLLNESFPQGFGFSRNPVGYIIATELRKTGKAQDIGFKVLSLWNQKNKPPMSERELKGIVKSAYSKDYTFGCNYPTLVNFCVDKDLCSYYQRFTAKYSQKGCSSEFISKGWPLVLTQSETLLYLILLEAERIEGAYPGERLFATYNLLHRLSGAGKGHIRSYLVSLRDSGLIELKIGSPFYWQHKATEIRRILPIPHPQSNT